MNCKPGDLAVVVRTHPTEAATAQFLGRCVTLTAIDPMHPGCWRYEEMPLRGRHRGQRVDWFSVPDEWLRPIRDPGDDAKDEMLRPLPTEVRSKPTAPSHEKAVPAVPAVLGGEGSKG